MRRLLLLALIAIGCLVGMGASSAGAYSSCTQTVSLNGNGSNVQAFGWVDCTSAVHIYDAACVQNLVSNGGWVDATQNPLTPGGNCGSWTGTTTDVGVSSGQFRPVCGRYYRGRQVTNVGFSGNTTQYSAGKKFC